MYTVHVLVLVLEQRTLTPDYGYCSKRAVPTAVPTGRLLAVDAPGDHMSDFRRATRLRERIDAAPDGGFNHLYLLNAPHSLERSRVELLHPASGRQLQLHTDQRSLQFYTGTLLLCELFFKTLLLRNSN